MPTESREPCREGAQEAVSYMFMQLPGRDTERVSGYEFTQPAGFYCSIADVIVTNARRNLARYCALYGEYPSDRPYAVVWRCEDLGPVGEAGHRRLRLVDVYEEVSNG